MIGKLEVILLEGYKVCGMIQGNVKLSSLSNPGHDIFIVINYFKFACKVRYRSGIWDRNIFSDS